MTRSVHASYLLSIALRTTFGSFLLLGLVSARAADLRVMKTGLGKGWIQQGTAISCGIVTTNPALDEDTIGTSCNVTATAITLTANSHPGSTFAGWGGDCASAGTSATCTVPAGVARPSVRAKFTLNTAVPALGFADLTPTGINTYLTGLGSSVNTQAEFIAALPREFRQNWILMTRSESLQTGTATFPRIMLVSADSKYAFTLSLAEPVPGLPDPMSYPGSHPNAIEFMQWDNTQKNFRFHEIVIKNIGGLDPISPTTFRFPARSRELNEDNQKCFACHSTRNVRNRGTIPGTTGDPIGSVKFKSKPNWDSYDSWGGMLAFNRDRIYKGSIEAAAFRKLTNLWTWQTNEAVRSVIEQLELQPPGMIARDVIERWDTPGTEGGPNDGHIRFAFDPSFPTVANEPVSTAGTNIPVTYNFQRLTPAATASNVNRDDVFVVLQHSGAGTRFGEDEGRGTNFFNNLYLGLNPARVADEMIPPPGSSYHATGNVPIDVRPIALAITNGCISVAGSPGAWTISGVTVPAFFGSRNGMSFNAVFEDTRRRAESVSRRKADIQKLNLDRTNDVYMLSSNPFQGLIDLYGSGTDGIVPAPTGPETPSVRRLRQLRQEVFRRPVAGSGGTADATALGGIYVDREDYAVNTDAIALFRYFLEPLGVSVDKWSMGVRGRSRTFSFADQFNRSRSYRDTFATTLGGSLGVSTCAAIMPLVAAEFARLPGPADTPAYTDIQRIFNKACIECHGGLNYPPVRNYGITLDFTEDENPPAGQRRLWKSLREARSLIGGPTCDPSTPTCTDAAATNVSNSLLYSRITNGGLLVHPYDPTNLAGSNEDCPNGLMPCGGPPLGKTDIETVRRWIVGASPHTEGDPHLKTVNNVSYDFQSAGEFVLLRDEGMELQARHSAVTTAGPLPPDAHTGLSSCVSVNTAVAMRIGDHRLTYQPALADKRGQESQTSGLQLRIDGKLAVLGAVPIPLQRGGRIVPTNGTGGLEVQIPGGTRVAVTPLFWDEHKIHFMQIDVYHGRAVDGIMGSIAPNNWLPRLSNGTFLGTRPASLAQRHHDLYETFADSWRVDATTSLFDYEPGLSPSSFVVPGWPAAKANGCVAPPQPGIPTQAVMPMIGKAQANQACANIADPRRRDNCVQDVMATGSAVFARAYLESQSLDERIQIAPPNLVSPPNNSRIPAARVDFTWKPVPGTESVDVSHYHCLWKSGERFDFNNCKLLSVDGNPLRGIVPPRLTKYLSPVICWIIILALLLAALILFTSNRRKAAAFLLVLVLPLALICWLQHRSSMEPASVRMANLAPGEIYRWKVVTDTKEGLITESETFRFEVEK